MITAGFGGGVPSMEKEIPTTVVASLIYEKKSDGNQEQTKIIETSLESISSSTPAHFYEAIERAMIRIDRTRDEGLMNNDFQTLLESKLRSVTWSSNEISDTTKALFTRAEQMIKVYTWYLTECDNFYNNRRPFVVFMDENSDIKDLKLSEHSFKNMMNWIDDANNVIPNLKHLIPLMIELTQERTSKSSENFRYKIELLRTKLRNNEITDAEYGSLITLFKLPK